MESNFLTAYPNWDAIAAPNLEEPVALMLRLKASPASALPPSMLQETAVIIH